MATIEFHGKRFRYGVDVGSGLVWLQDDDTKQQWQCKTQQKTRVVSGGRENSTRAFLTAVELTQNDKSIGLAVDTVTPDWGSSETLEMTLEMTPINAMEFTRAQFDGMLARIAMLLTRLSTLESELIDASHGITRVRDEIARIKASHSSITFHGTQYNYDVDVDGSRVWFEDHATKHQWEWRSDMPQSNRTVLDGKDVPESVFLAALKHLLLVGPTASTGRVHLECTNDSLRLVVSLSLAMTNWRAHETLVLSPLPLDALERLLARLTDARAALTELEDRVAATEPKATTAQLEFANVQRELGDVKTKLHIETAVLVGAAVVLLVLALTVPGPWAIVWIIMLFAAVQLAACVGNWVLDRRRRGF